MDLLQRDGHYPLPPQAPKTLGVEFSGTIESLGDRVKEDFKEGDEVFGRCMILILIIVVVG